MGRSWGSGRIQSGEADLIIDPPGGRAGAPLVILAHGAGGTPASYAPAAMRQDLDLLAANGCLVVVTTLGGPNEWMTDLVVHPTTGRIAGIRTWAQGQGADVSRMALIGDSMGGANALNYTWRAPDNVKAVALRIPVVAADALHDRDPGGLGLLMNTCWGSGANWEAAVPTRDPSAPANAALIAAIRDRVQIWYSTNDPTILPADITSYVAATGVRALPIGAIAHTLHPGVNVQHEVGWILGKLAA